MKAWILRWLGIPPWPAGNDDNDEETRLVATVIERLAEAQQQHISDLRVLLDKSDTREQRLSEMVQYVLESKFLQPQHGMRAGGENRLSPIMPAEQLTDVAIFDEQADGEEIAKHAVREKELNAELDSILDEEHEYRKEVAPVK